MHIYGRKDDKNNIIFINTGKNIKLNNGNNFYSKDDNFYYENQKIMEKENNLD